MASISPASSIEAMLFSGGMYWKRAPGRDRKRCRHRRLIASLRSMCQSRSCGDTPNSCCSTPRVQSAAVCWYSGTPTGRPPQVLRPLDARVGPHEDLRVEEAPDGKDRQPHPRGVALRGHDQERRERHLGDVELGIVQLPVEDLAGVGDGHVQVDPVPGRTAPSSTGRARGLIAIARLSFKFGITPPGATLFLTERPQHAHREVGVLWVDEAGGV